MLPQVRTMVQREGFLSGEEWNGILPTNYFFRKRRGYVQCAGVAATVTQPGEEYNRSRLCEAYRLAGIEEVGIFIGASRRGTQPWG